MARKKKPPKKQLTQAERKARKEKRQNSDSNKDENNGPNKHPQPAAKMPNKPEPAKPEAAVVPRVVNEVETNARQKSPGDENAEKQPRWWRQVDWDLVFSGCLVLFAFVSTGVAYFQWRAMADQNADITRQTDLMEKTIAQTDETLNMMQFEQRAWVSPGTPFLSGEMTDANFAIVVPILNSGNTPAYMRQYATSPVSAPHDADVAKIIAWHKEQTIPEYNSTIAPDVTLNMRIQSERLNIC